MESFNSTVDPSKAEDNWKEEALLPSIFLGICFLVGIPGNALVIWTVLFKLKQHSLTVVVILNLAVADFVVLFTLPIWIHSLLDAWFYGLAACKFLTYFMVCLMYASVFLITLMSLDRFFAIIFPIASRTWRTKHIIYLLIAGMWILAFIFGIPVLFVKIVKEENGRSKCNDRLYASDQQKIAILLLETLTGFIIPFSVLSVCYTVVAQRIKQMKFQRKSKSGKLIACIVIAFALCWLPYHFLNLLSVVAISITHPYPDTSKALMNGIAIAGPAAGAFSFISNCLNPILYGFSAWSIHRNVRKSFLELFRQLASVPKEDPDNDTTG
ncbi:leukotriene B4 receptor 1-like [Protopterus annectens]|uniref:leukotriene B4 receptor 1-like n=1 Tax=Protopterus annectens TaxID=7888 RepID=UPI001CFBA65F|nr:leukotriene B4 receptor 1-like [Protopterus annectens]